LALKTVAAAGIAAYTEPESGSQWGLRKIRADQVWNEGATGQGVIVAVIDTGVDLDFPDLVDGAQSNLVQGYDAIRGYSGKGAAQDDKRCTGTAMAGLIRRPR
jgi:subtilisin family serine protease